MDVEDDPQMVARAREMGWRPQEEYTGNPDKWVDAAEYVERGEKILPILQADRDRLRRELAKRDQKVQGLQTRLDTTVSMLEDLNGNFTQLLEQRLKAQRAELTAQLRSAVEDRDVDAELEARNQLEELNTAEKQAREKQALNKEKLKGTKTPAEESNDGIDPAIKEEIEDWKAENSWYGGKSPEDRKRTRALERVAEDLRDDGEESVGREFLDKCLAVLQEQDGTGGRRPASKVEGGGNPPSTSRSGKGYNALPADAKAACDADVETFVGEGRMFQTKKEWQEYYAKHYFQG